MKRRINFLGFSIIVLMLEFFTVIVYANPIVFFDPLVNPILTTFLLTGVFILGTTLEYKVFKHLESRIKVEPKRLFSSFFKINLVTFPLTQILAYIVYIYFVSLFWFYVLIIEIFVVIIEWFLLKIFLNHDHNLQINPRSILFDSIKVNIVSFLFGIGLFIVFIYVKF